MHKLLRNSIILAICLLVSLWAIIPPEKKLRRGKDLAGGVGLVYGVEVKPGDPADTLAKVISVVKERLDPNGMMEISIVGEGTDRIEITMPLPSDRVKRIKADFEAELASLAAGTVTPEQFDRIASSTPQDREKEIDRLAGGSQDRRDHIERAFKARDEIKAARAQLDEARKRLADVKTQADALRKVNPDDPLVAQVEATGAPFQQSIDEKAVRIADLEIAYEGDRAASITSGLNPDELRRALLLSDRDVIIAGDAEKVVRLPSPRRRALDDIFNRYASQKPKIEAVIAKWNEYEKERRSLDDPQDIVRILKGAGVLNFRITPSTGEVATEQDLRRQLREGGPRSVRSEEARWYKINKIENWVRSEKDLEAIKTNPSGFFQAMGYAVEEYKGEYYMLCWDRPGFRLTENDGTWSVTAFQGQDQLGRPAIDFRMDALGADKLGRLTGPNVNKQMAVLLDDEVYTAPRLQSRISSQGQITGSFTKAEIDYIVRVLSAGSLQAKLSAEPISSSVLGPQLGADNLRASFVTGIVAFSAVAGFMIVYYFGSGVIAVVALLVNFLLVLAIMAVNKTAFSIPGIAGIVLTFGQAVDANVLVYERMREELNHGHDLKTSIRLGFSRALPPIVDGNISNLIICVVLGLLGTQEIRGFAITLGIGVVTTLFSTLFVSRFIFTVLTDHFHWRKASQLPMAVPFVQRLLTPHVDWMKHRWTLLAGLAVFLVFTAVITVRRGSELLGMEFRGGTAVTLAFKQATDPAGAPVRMKLTRAEVEKRVKAIAEHAPAGSSLRHLNESQVIAVNPDSDSVTSSTFTIKSLVTDSNQVQSALATAFADLIESRPALHFDGADLRPESGAPAYPISTPVLGESIDRPDLRTPSGEFYNGLAIVLAHLDPPPSLAELRARLDETRSKAAYSDTLSRRHEVIAVDGSDAAVRTAVVLIQDPAVPYSPGDQRWSADVRDREWRLSHEALAENQTLASVQSFNAAIARSFAAQGAVCTVISLLLLTIYVFTRFGTLRWAVAATVPLFADVIGIVGLIGVAQMLYQNESTHALARSLGLLPFDFDLAQVAAVLTIVGYSLNDKIIILDRIRENKGKLPYASYQVINDSINQTLSRTVITAGAHMITTIVLYLYGGEAVRGFAYTFNLGVLLGTYTSIVSTPLVWSRKADWSRSATPAKPADERLPAGAVPPAFSNGSRSAEGSGAVGPAAGSI